MAVVIDAFVGGALSKISALVKEKGSMILGVRDELSKLLRKLERLKIFLVDAESKAIQDVSIRSWLGELKDFMYDADDVIDLCMIEGTKLLEEDQPFACTVPWVRICFPFISCFSDNKFRYEIAEQIKSLNEKLKEIEENKPTRLEVTTARSHGISRPQTSPEMVESDYVGADIKEATQSLVGSLIEESEHKTKCRVWGIVGMGGIGKTTLASKVYNHPSIVSDFTIRIWVCVSQTFSETDILKQIIQGAGGVCGEISSKALLHSLLISSLSSKFLIVLDDLWSTDVWEHSLRSPIEKCGAPSGRIIVTTRDVAVVNKMRASIHNVEKMNNNDGWTLLCKVFGDDGNGEEMLSLKDIGIQIVDKCDGLPLAIKAIAGVLASSDISREKWEKLLRSHAWSMDQLPKELTGALYLSYDDLPAHLKQCFLYFTLYPEDSDIYCEDLIRYWTAEGFILEDKEDEIMEDIAKDYYNELIRRNLLQRDQPHVDNISCKMHDLLRSLGQLLVGEENICIDDGAAARISLNSNSSRSVRRLSIQYTEDTLTFTSDVLRNNTQSLRSLLSHGTLPSNILTMFESNVLLKKFSCLRVLDLSGSGIKRLPDSVGKLVHLRYLDVNRTKISMLPDSIENLVNLQALCLQQCKNLRNLPRGITKLCNLRCLIVDDTPLACLPKGLDQLKQLNDLQGFFVGNVESSSESCKVDELQPLTQLRILNISKLERVNTGTSILTNKHYLRELSMSFSWAQYGEMEIKRIEKVMEELLPPPTLQQLKIETYPGSRYPRWLSLYNRFSRLKSVKLFNCRSCTQLPPLGKLPQLKQLEIKGANSIVKVGLELLFGGHTQTGESAFPKLEILWVSGMDHWEEWALGDSQYGKLLPCLKILHILHCPKLRFIPAGLQYATKLEVLLIRGAGCIQEVKNLPYLSKVLTVKHCPCLQEIHHLPSLRELIIVKCPQLRHVAGLNSLRILLLNLDSSAERLPDWLSELSLSLELHPRPDFQFYLYCYSSILFQRCLKGREFWPIIQRFPQVNITAGLDESIYYTNTSGQSSG